MIHISNRGNLRETFCGTFLGTLKLFRDIWVQIEMQPKNLLQ